MKKLLLVGILMSMFASLVFADEYNEDNYDKLEIIQDVAIGVAAEKAIKITASKAKKVISSVGKRVVVTGSTATAVGSSVIEGAAVMGVGITAAPAVVGAAVVTGVVTGVSLLWDKF